MKKNWSNPELNNLSVGATESDSVQIATDASGANAANYTLEDANNPNLVSTLACWGFYWFNPCTCKWEKLNANNLCDAIKEAIEKLKNVLANGCSA